MSFLALAGKTVVLQECESRTRLGDSCMNGKNVTQKHCYFLFPGLRQNVRGSGEDGGGEGPQRGAGGSHGTWGRAGGELARGGGGGILQPPQTGG